MKKTILTCDRCKGNVDDINDFFTVEAGLLSYSKKEQRRAEWCRECCVKVGFLPVPYNNPGNLAPSFPAPSLEDIIREIIREEIDNSK